MKSEILSIGDELLIGQVLNTNAAFISKQLNALGIEVSRVTTIGDDENRILSAMKDAWKSNDVVIATGGLGPTHDDISKNVVAKFFRKKLALDRRVLAHIRARFRSFGIKKMPDVNIGQAMIPEDFKVLRNNKGTAPGLLFHEKGKTFIILPGVPHEMIWLMDKWVNAQLRFLYKKKLGQAILHKTLLTVGIGESVLSESIGDVTKILTEGTTLAFLPKTSGVRLRISVRDSSSSKAAVKLKRIETIIRDRVGKYVYGSDDGTLEAAVFELLISRKATLSTAESCTGGMLSMRITNVAGSSAVFRGGVIAYQNVFKSKEFDISDSMIKRFGAVSKEVAIAMANGARHKFGATFALSITGIAGPTGGTKTKPVGTVWIGIAEKGRPTTARLFNFGEGRSIVRERSTDLALEMLRTRLLE